MMIRQISPKDLARLIANEHAVHLLDVRQPWENATAALPNSRLVPLDHLPDSVAALEFQRDDLVVVYCHHGIRSLTAARILEHAGCTNVASLAGGIDAWSCTVDPTVPRY